MTSQTPSRTVSVLCWLLLGCFCAQGQTVSDVPAGGAKYRVLVTVTGDERAKDETESAISAALRALGDVETVTQRENAGFILTANVLPSRNKKGAVTGYTIAYLSTRRIEGTLAAMRDIFDRTIKADCIPLGSGPWGRDNFSKQLTGLPAGAEFVMLFDAGQGGADDLRDICNQIVAKFDTKVLKQARREVEEMMYPKSKP